MKIFGQPKNSEINEVILSLKTLKNPQDEKISAIDNSNLFVNSNQTFVFDKRGKMPKDLTSTSVKESCYFWIY